MTIDLQKFRTGDARVIAGRDKGAKIRTDLALERVDAVGETVRVQVPFDVVAVNPSFFLGLFGPSVRRLGRTGFTSRYQFDCSETVRKDVDFGIERALATASPLPDLR